MKVLIVDDNDDIRQLLRLQLGLLPDMDLAEARDGSEAVRCADALDPDVIVLDLEMPVMTGSEALPFLREAHPDAAIVLHTSTPRSLTPPEVTDAADDYVEKGGDIVGCVRALGRSSVRSRPAR